jgi:hypothetical protein
VTDLLVAPASCKAIPGSFSASLHPVDRCIEAGQQVRSLSAGACVRLPAPVNSRLTSSQLAGTKAAAAEGGGRRTA